MDIANQSQQVLILIADNGFVPSLEQIADFAMAAVEVLRVRLLQFLHEFGQRTAAGLKKQVDVVGHQAIGIDSDTELGAVLL